MKRIIPFIIILVVLGAALGSAWYLTRTIPASPTLGSSPAVLEADDVDRIVTEVAEAVRRQHRTV